jgi:hypothetical protein
MGSDRDWHCRDRRLPGTAFSRTGKGVVLHLDEVGCGFKVRKKVLKHEEEIQK